MGVTNHSLVHMLLLKSKLTKMAEKRKFSLQGLLIRAIYMSASQLLPEDSFHLKCIKYQDLVELSRKCAVLAASLTINEKANQNRLKVFLENSLKIDLDDCEHFNKVLADFSEDSFAEDSDSSDSSEGYIKTPKKLRQNQY